MQVPSGWCVHVIEKAHFRSIPAMVNLDIHNLKDRNIGKMSSSVGLYSYC